MSPRRRPAVMLAPLLAAACSGPSGTLYVTSGASDAMIVLDAADGDVLRAIDLDRRAGELDEPHGVAVSPDGGHVYVTLAHGEPTLWKYERPGNRLVGRLSLGTAGAARIAVSADGATGYVADYERGSGGRPGEVVAVALRDLEVTARARPCSAPHDARPDPRGAIVAVACALSDEIVFLGAADLAEHGRVAAGPDPGPPGAPRYRPMNVAWLRPGLLAVTLMASSEVVFLDSRGTELARVTVGSHPAQIAAHARSGLAVVANRGDRSASILGADPFRERARVDLGVAHPHGVAIDAAGRRAYVSYEGDVDGPGGVVALDLSAQSVAWTAPAGFYTLGVAFAPD